MKKEKYHILYEENRIYSDLTEEEYFDIIEKLSMNYYQTGYPDPQKIQTEIIGEN